MKYSYPKENRDQYLGTITFSPIQYIPPRIGGNVFNIVNNAFRNFQNANVGGVRAQGNQRNSQKFEEGSSNLSTGKFSEKVLYDQSVTLYLPQTITIQDGVVYDNIDLGVIGGLAEYGVKNGGGALGSYLGAAGRSFSDAGRITDSTDYTNLIALRIAQETHGKISGTDEVLKSATRVSVNPNTRALFKSVVMREFAFTFKMIATSPEEAVEIGNIVKFFREELYPESIMFEGPGNVAVGYKFPSRFEIRMSYNGKQVGTKILPSFLRSVSTVINPTSMSFHADGMPSEVDINIAFGEGRTLSKQDIKDGY